MAREQNQLRLASPLETEPTFSMTLRGYNRREVDHYAHIAETQLHAAIAQRDELATRIRTLTDQLHQAHSELVELRRRPKLDDKVSFRHLGPRVEQILAEAEQQAEAVRAAAAESLTNERAALAAERAKVSDEFNRMVREYESNQQARRAEEEVEIAKRLEAVRVEVAEGQSYARKVRAEAEEIISAAQAEARRLITEASAQAAAIRGDVAEQAGVVRAKAERDAAAIALSAEQYARETREEAEQHAHQTRASAEQHSRQVTAAAEQAATQLRLQAEQHAAQVRAAAEKHAARLHAFGPSSTVDTPMRTSTVDSEVRAEEDAAPTSPAVPSSPGASPASPASPGNPVGAPRATADGAR
jgi:cell division septum initiation protein DivIVA